MAYSETGLNAALAGVTTSGVGDVLSLHTADPGTTGAAEDTAVPRQEAGWGAIGGGTVDSSQVQFPIERGGGTRDYSHFGVWSLDGDYVTGGQLDQSEQFSDNGGTYNFTATLTAANASA